jgi:hypothetical protein
MNINKDSVAVAQGRESLTAAQNTPDFARFIEVIGRTQLLPTCK